MKKNLLSFLLTAATTLGLAQHGSIAVVSIPDDAEVGSTVELKFSYTSDVPVSLTAQLFQTKENSLTTDYNTWKGVKTLDGLQADTNAEVTVQFTIPSTVDPSAIIGDRKYVFDLKLTQTGAATDFGWSNGTEAHTINILPSSVAVDNLAFITTPVATVEAGGSIDVDFGYTLKDTANLKVGLVIYDSQGTYVSDAKVDGKEVSVAFAKVPKTTTTPVQKQVTLPIPAGLAPSTDLPAGQVYKTVISIFTTSWAYVTDKKSPVTVTVPATGISDVALSNVKVYPNPATDFVNVSYVGNLQGIQLYNAAGVELNVNTTVLNTGEASINTSTLGKGIYLVKIATLEGTTSVKLVK